MRLFIAGDFCPQGRVSENIQSGCYNLISDDLAHLMRRADYSIVNLEAPICENENYSPIEKEGPNLKAPSQTIETLKSLNINCVTLANNHIKDYGEQGIINTISLCKQHGIDYVGAGKILRESEKILYVNVSETRLAIINCCEHEFSVTGGDYAGAQGLDPIKQFYQIQEARNNADVVVVIVHGGIEMFQYPTFRMRDTYRFFIDAGADIVINHHQHCRCGKEEYKGKQIYYGLGNFCFDWTGRPDTWYRGYALDITINGSTIESTNVIPILQCLESPIIQIDTTTDLDTELIRLSEVIGDDSKLAAVNKRCL